MERVLAIGAHPDDVEIGVGGTLLRHRDDGNEITVLTLSRGARGGDQHARALEAVKAAEVLGARLILEDLPDTAIPENNPTVGIIETVVRDIDPTIVYVHSGHDTHQDHRNTHHAALSAVRQVPNVYCYQSPTATLAFHPLRFVAVDTVIEEKLEVISTYASQTALRWYLEPELLRSTARYWGRFGDSRYCEPLEIERERSRRRHSVVAGSIVAGLAEPGADDDDDDDD